jgi:hypothetical protein
MSSPSLRAALSLSLSRTFVIAGRVCVAIPALMMACQSLSHGLAIGLLWRMPELSARDDSAQAPTS